MTNGLTALKVEKLKNPGRDPDADGLYLQVGPTGAKSWLLRYQRVQLAARLYPYRLMGDARGDELVLEADADRDRDYLNQDPFLSLYARDERRRPGLLDFCAGDLDDEGSGAFVLRPDAGGRPDLTVRARIEVEYRGIASGSAIRC